MIFNLFVFSYNLVVDTNQHWIRICNRYGSALDPNSMILWIRIQWFCGSGFMKPGPISISSGKKNEKMHFFRKLFVIFVNKSYKLKVFFTLNFVCYKPGKKLSSKVLLWIRIRIHVRSGFSDFVYPCRSWFGLS
jgi:hypothetical protein